MKSFWILFTVFLLQPAVFSAEFPPQLQPHADKYAQEHQAVNNARAKQADTLRTRYAAALAAAQTAAMRANQGGSLAAIEAELKELKSDLVASAFPPDLPRSLVPARREFATGVDALEKVVAARTKVISARYLQALMPLEQTAAQQKNTALAEAVTGEKERVLAGITTGVAPPLRKNALRNGDFSQADADGLPKGWQPKGNEFQKDSVPWQNDASILQEGSEKFVRFRRKASVRQANLAPVSVIMVPERAKVAEVSVRLRVEGLIPAKGFGQYPGVGFRVLDAAGNSPGWEWAVAKEDTRWRTVTGTYALQPGAKTLEMAVCPWSSAGLGAATRFP